MIGRRPPRLKFTWLVSLVAAAAWARPKSGRGAARPQGGGTAAIFHLTIYGEGFERRGGSLVGSGLRASQRQRSMLCRNTAPFEATSIQQFSFV